MSLGALRYCRIRENKGHGIGVVNNGRGVIEDCEITGNGSTDASTVAITTGADPIVRYCRIRENKSHGIYVSDNSRGTTEDCESTGNAYAGVAVRTGADPSVRGCRLAKDRRPCTVEAERGARRSCSPS